MSQGHGSKRCCGKTDNFELARVTITLCKIGKHQLPVEDDCAFSHNEGFDLHSKFCPEVGAEGGSSAANLGRVQRCMDEAQCSVVDDRLQMVIFRDPRASAVSSYYHLSSNKHIPEDMDIDTFVLENFADFCKWLLIRMVLFKQLTPKHKYMCFWYDEWKADPVRWHRRLFGMLGVHVPETVVAAATDAALADEFPFFSKGRDAHGGSTPPPADRTYRDDISNDTAYRLDEIMRELIPPELAARLHAGS